MTDPTVVAVVALGSHFLLSDVATCDLLEEK